VSRFTLQISSPVALAVWLTTVPLAGLAAPAPANRLIDEQRARDRELTQDRYPPGVPESPAAPALDALPAALEEPGAVMRDARLDVDAAGLIAPHRLADLLSLDFVPDNSDGWTAFHNDGELIAGGTFRLGNRQEGSNRGVIRAGGDIVAVQAVVDVPASAEGLPGAGAEGLPGSPAAMLANSGIIDAGRDLYMELVENDGGMLRAGRDAFIWQTWRIETNPFLPSPPGAQGLIDALRDVFMFQAGGNAVPDGAEPATGSEAPAPPAGASVSFGALMMNVLPETDERAAGDAAQHTALPVLPVRGTGGAAQCTDRDDREGADHSGARVGSGDRPAPGTAATGAARREWRCVRDRARPSGRFCDQRRAERLDNTGFIVSNGELRISADTVLNRKRSAWYYEKRKVKGGKLKIWGDTVQPGGFMQAAMWQLDAAQVHSVSGEFRVLGESVADTDARSAAFVTSIAEDLGADYRYTVARDNLQYRFDADFGFKGVLGMAAGFMVSGLPGPEISAFLAGGTEVGVGNHVASAIVTQTLSSSVSQLVATGGIDVGVALQSGLTSGARAGISQISVNFGLDAAESAALRAVSEGAFAGSDGSSFGNAFAQSLITDGAAYGANQIGDAFAANAGSLNHILAHGFLGALAEAAATDAGMDETLGLSATDRGRIMLTALSMLAGGGMSEGLGHDGAAGAQAARNATENNYLKPHEQDAYAAARNACRSDAECLAAVDAKFQIPSDLNNLVLRAQTDLCVATGQCGAHDGLIAEATSYLSGLRFVNAEDPENPWAADQFNAESLAYNTWLHDWLLTRPLSAEVVAGEVRTDDPEAHVFGVQPEVHYTGLVRAQNAGVVISVATAAALSVTPVDEIAVGTILVSRAGSFLAQVARVGGQKVLRFLDGTMARAGSAEAREAVTARLGNLEAPLEIPKVGYSEAKALPAAKGIATAEREATGFLGRTGNELKNVPYQKVRNEATQINGCNFSGHALDQMQNRGLMPSVVENALKTGTQFPTRAGTTGFYDAVNNVRVIVNSGTRRVVTVIPGAP
jgi:adhesin HecA-like repeat protein